MVSFPSAHSPPPTWASFCCCPSEGDIQRDVRGTISQVASVCAGLTCSPRRLCLWPHTVLAHGALALATPQPLRRGGWGRPMCSSAHWGPLCSVLGPGLSYVVPLLLTGPQHSARRASCSVQRLVGPTERMWVVGSCCQAGVSSVSRNRGRCSKLSEPQTPQKGLCGFTVTAAQHLPLGPAWSRES